MTFKNSEMARGARQLKAVAAVVAVFPVTLAVLTLTLAPSEARPEALLVAALGFCVVVFMWVYASKPSIFTGEEGIFGDELRTSYHVPELPASRAVTGSRSVPVTEHIYTWQEVRRVDAGARVWTPAYLRLLGRQLVLTILGALVFGAVAAGVAIGLGESVGPMWFVAAAIILPVGFAMSHRSGLVDSRDYPTAPMAPLPDLTWRPELVPAPAVVAEARQAGEAYAA